MEIKMKFVEPIIELANLCTANKVPFTLNICHDGMQMRFPWCVGDVVCHSASYGSYDECVETFRFPWDDDDVTSLIPEEAAIRIADYHHHTV